jgi:hypothetical protein
VGIVQWPESLAASKLRQPGWRIATFQLGCRDARSPLPPGVYHHLTPTSLATATPVATSKPPLQVHPP